MACNTSSALHGIMPFFNNLGYTNYMIIHTRVPDDQVPAFEELLGFKTTGEIYIDSHDPETQAKIDSILEELYLAKPLQTPSDPH